MVILSNKLQGLVTSSRPPLREQLSEFLDPPLLIFRMVSGRRTPGLICEHHGITRFLLHETKFTVYIRIAEALVEMEPHRDTHHGLAPSSAIVHGVKEVGDRVYSLRGTLIEEDTSMATQLVMGHMMVEDP